MKPTNVTLSHFRAFVAVADHGSFVAAANALRLSQPALSQRVRQLEDEIGSPLFMRTTRRVHLTGVGLSLLPQARHILDQMDDIVGGMQAMVERRQGRILIACLPSVAWRLMPAVLAHNANAFPGIRVVVRDMSMRQMKEGLLAGEIDVAIGSLTGDLAEFSSVPVLRDRIHVLFARGDELEGHASVAWASLAQQPFVAMSEDTGIREIVDAAAAAAGDTLDCSAEVSSLATVIGLVEQGVGVTALPGLALPNDQHPALAHRPLASPEVSREIAVIWWRSSGLSPAASTILTSIAAVRDAKTIDRTGGDFDWIAFRAP